MDKTPLEQSVAYAKGDTAKQHAWEDGFVAGVSYQIEKEARKLVLGEELTEAYNRKADEVWKCATGKSNENNHSR
jgi:hypothetical protein